MDTGGDMKPKILIIDDDEAYLNSLENVLKDEYEIVKARSLEEAKEKMDKSISLTLIDIRLSQTDMTNRDGLIFLEWQRMNFPDIPAIVMSMYREFELAVDALNLGAKYFLQKPINIPQLKGVLKEILGEK